MTQDQVWTIGRLLEWTTKYLRQRQADSPRLDAEVLLAHARKCQRIELYTAFDEVANDEVRTRYRQLVRLRAEGTPVAYLVESREFYALPFRVTPAVLIPRPETEFVIVRLLDLAKQQGLNQDAVSAIADVGTGSGILAVCAAYHLSQSRVLALDTSAEALEIARFNAAKHQVSDRVTFLESDLLSAVTPELQLDFVLSNPPYVSRAEYDALPAEVKNHEPYAALVAGETGSEVIERLIPQAADRLKAGGWLLLEVSPMIAKKVEMLLRDHPRFESVSVTKDLSHLPRVLAAQAR